MSDYRQYVVNSAAEMDAAICVIIAVQVLRGGEVAGTLYVEYSDESVKQAKLIPILEQRGVEIVWRKIVAIDDAADVAA
jgi:hypothetical protein